jgi:hypothetical protein
MAFNIVMFGAIGKTIFKGILFDVIVDWKIENNEFTSIISACYCLFVLQTTSNFPDVMMPFYKENRLTSIYFILFLLFNCIILVNMLLAIFYTFYRQEMEV